ncbi:hypothetical protein B0H14DRAFT_954458 [Mycena olivaceomarginata]|nr:hypothetical protein B0H14DRAFT_954458 [Mycena olivaceomarginata]
MSNPQDVSRRIESTSDAKPEATNPQMEPASDPKGLSPAKQRLLETKLRLADADEEISGTLAHLQRLQLRRKDILVDLNILTSPILNLPPEIICEIFIHCLPPPRTLPDPRDAPLLLGHVCRRWRSIAYSFTQLWSSVTVSDVLSAMLLPPPRAGLLDMLDAWLIHSGDNLLSVSIVPDAQNPDIPLVLGRSPIFGTIRHTSHRWRELEIVRRLEDFQVLLNRDAPWNLPHLVKLTLLLANNGRHPSGFPPNLLSNLNDAPALREVHVMGFAPLNLLIPWSQLTTVHAENLLPIECLQTLAATTSLIDGTFSIWIEQFFHLPATAPHCSPPSPQLVNPERRAVHRTPRLPRAPVNQKVQPLHWAQRRLRAARRLLRAVLRPKGGRARHPRRRPPRGPHHLPRSHGGHRDALLRRAHGPDERAPPVGAALQLRAAPEHPAPHGPRAHRPVPRAAAGRGGRGGDAGGALGGRRGHAQVVLPRHDASVLRWRSSSGVRGARGGGNGD